MFYKDKWNQKLQLCVEYESANNDDSQEKRNKTFFSRQDEQNSWDLMSLVAQNWNICWIRGP